MRGGGAGGGNTLLNGGKTFSLRFCSAEKRAVSSVSRIAAGRRRKSLLTAGIVSIFSCLSALSRFFSVKIRAVALVFRLFFLNFSYFFCLSPVFS